MKMIAAQKARPAKLPSALMRGLPSSTRVMFTPKSGGPQVADDGDHGDVDGDDGAQLPRLLLRYSEITSW